MKAVFFYGLFMDTGELTAMGLSPSALGAARLPDYELVIGDRATLRKRPQSSAYGVVMRLSGGDLDRLYSMPGVEGYRPENVKALINGDPGMSCLCYNLPMEQLGLRPNRDYAVALAALCAELGFPQAYLDHIAGFTQEVPRD